MILMFISKENKSQYMGVQFHLNIAKYSSTLNKQNIRKCFPWTFHKCYSEGCPTIK